MDRKQVFDIPGRRNYNRRIGDLLPVRLLFSQIKVLLINIKKGSEMMIFEETYTLYNGVQVPRLGLGTWFIPDAAVAQAVQEAVRIGYRHFDTAQAYENEQGVGEGVRACALGRGKPMQR